MKRRMRLSICLSVLLTLVLTACAGAAEVKLTPDDGAAGGVFGKSVSISGDYAIVGAPYDDDNNDTSGSAYIWKRDRTTWGQQVKITASDGAVDDVFGWAVSISGDYAMVDTPGGDGSGDDSGSAYIWKHDGTTWSQQTKITASDGATDDVFGLAVSISSDYAIVGAYGDDGHGDDSGSAYIYDIQTTEPPITGDLNGDDLLTLADAVIALRMAAGSCDPIDAADVSDDGVVNSLDALMIMQAAAGLITL